MAGDRTFYEAIIYLYVWRAAIVKGYFRVPDSEVKVKKDQGKGKSRGARGIFLA